MHNLNKYPPLWAPDAVPSNQGWKHPVTGELLVSIVLDPSVYQTQEPVTETKIEVPVVEPVVIKPTPEVVEVQVPLKTEPPKPKGSQKAKPKATK